MTEKLKKRIDLRTLSGLHDEEESQLMSQNTDKFAYYEAKIEKCLAQFNDLNMNNKEQLGIQKQKLQTNFDKTIQSFENQLLQNFDDLKKFSKMERHIHKCSKKEIDDYMSDLSSQFVKFTQKHDDSRSKDMQEMIKIRQENESLREQLIDLTNKIEVHDDKFHK